MQKTLCLVPHQALARKWRQSSIGLDGRLLPFSVAGLVSQLLKEQGHPYRESLLLEELAIWEAVWELAEQLNYYAPMINFPGFIRDLHLLFNGLGGQDVNLEQLTSENKQELMLLYEKYEENLVQHGVLHQHAQLMQAMKYWPKSQLAQEIDTVEVYYLGELSSLEKQFIRVITDGKTIIHREFSEEAGSVTGMVVEDPKEEVEQVALKIVELIQAGIEPSKLAISSPQLSNYLPIIIPIFEKHSIPWTSPNISLASTPLGKAVTSLVQVLGGNYAKQDLQQLAAVGWGLPIKLTFEERRALKLAPEATTGITAWYQELAKYPGWEKMFILLQQIKVSGRKPVRYYTAMLMDILIEFDLEYWPTHDELSWATHLQAWDGFQQIFQGLSEGRQLMTFRQFSQLLQNAMSNYNLPKALTFHQRVSVASMEPLIGMEYHSIFLLGMTEDTFPSKKKRNWLTKQMQDDHSLLLYEQILLSADFIHLSYAEADLAGSVSIASEVFPPDVERVESVPTLVLPGDYGNYKPGILEDPKIIEKIIQRYQNKQLSVSRLNTYAACPYRFFCGEILALVAEEVEEEDITALEEGTLLHFVLKRFWELKGETPIMQLLTEIYAEKQEPLTNRVIRMMEKFTNKDVELVNNSEYQPTYLEHYFKDLEITTPNGNLNIHGVIDRIDINDQGDYVIYDYKTGSSPLVREIVAGIDIQLQIYTLAAEKILGRPPTGIAYYTMKDGRRSGLWSDSNYQKLGLRRSSSVLSEVEWQELPGGFQEIITGYVQQIFSGYFPIEPRQDSICNFCDFRGICRREG